MPTWPALLIIAAGIVLVPACGDDPPAACPGGRCGPGMDAVAAARSDASADLSGGGDGGGPPPTDAASESDGESGGRDAGAPGDAGDEAGAEPAPDAAAPDDATLAPADLAADLSAETAPAVAADMAPAPPEAAPPVASVAFSRPGGTFVAPFALELVAPVGVQLFVTRDGSVPTEQSPPYSGPFTVDGTATVTVLAVAGTSRVLTREVYLRVADDLADFSSNLPLVVLHSYSRPEPPRDQYTDSPGALVITAPAGAAPARPLGAADTVARVGFRVRGHSTRFADQRNFAVELWGLVDGDDADRPVLGLPAESDWVLHAPGDIDLSLMRNALIFALSNRVGRYAPRTRFVEVFIESEGRPVSRASYRGVYTLIEKIKRNPRRVPIARLRPTDVLPPAITGGYLFKVDDNFAPGETPLRAGGLELELDEPEWDEITAAQRAYLTGFIDEMVAAQAAPGGVHPVTGLHYSDYLDVDSWIDLHILNVFAKNADSLRLSAYYHKDRGGKVVAGPLWDLDRSSGANDDRVRSPEGWSVPNGTRVFEYPWWAPLFQDPAFADRYWRRFEELLATHLRSDVITPIIVNMAAELSQAQQRHFARWPRVQPAFGYAGEVYRLTNWFDARIAWARANLRKYD